MGKGERKDRRWRYEPVSEDLIYGSSISNSIYSGGSEYQTIEVLDSGAFGRVLILDGKTQSAEIDEFISKVIKMLELSFQINIRYPISIGHHKRFFPNKFF